MSYLPKTPTASTPDALRRMTRQRRRDTVPELALRRALRDRGLRYRVHRRPLPTVRREADVVFSRARVAVFVDSCFWHACPTHATWPKANAEWWREKLEANVARDRDTDSRLEAEGWHVIRVWEHEDPVEAAATIERLVTARAGPDGGSASRGAAGTDVEGRRDA
jgi:DNA mismatch endonuclease, patch repair protein